MLIENRILIYVLGMLITFLVISSTLRKKNDPISRWSNAQTFRILFLSGFSFVGSALFLFIFYFDDLLKERSIKTKHQKERRY